MCVRTHTHIITCCCWRQVDEEGGPHHHNHQAQAGSNCRLLGAHQKAGPRRLALLAVTTHHSPTIMALFHHHYHNNRPAVDYSRCVGKPRHTHTLGGGLVNEVGIPFLFSGSVIGIVVVTPSRPGCRCQHEEGAIDGIGYEGKKKGSKPAGSDPHVTTMALAGGSHLPGQPATIHIDFIDIHH